MKPTEETGAPQLVRASGGVVVLATGGVDVTLNPFSESKP